MSLVPGGLDELAMLLKCILLFLPALQAVFCEAIDGKARREAPIPYMMPYACAFVNTG